MILTPQENKNHTKMPKFHVLIDKGICHKSKQTGKMHHLNLKIGNLYSICPS